MAQQGRALGVLSEDLSLISSTHINDSHLHVTSVPENLSPFSELYRDCMHLVCTNKQGRRTHIHTGKK